MVRTWCVKLQTLHMICTHRAVFPLLTANYRLVLCYRIYVTCLLVSGEQCFDLRGVVFIVNKREPKKRWGKWMWDPFRQVASSGCSSWLPVLGSPIFPMISVHRLRFIINSKVPFDALHHHLVSQIGHHMQTEPCFVSRSPASKFPKATSQITIQASFTVLSRQYTKSFRNCFSI